MAQVLLSESERTFLLHGVQVNMTYTFVISLTSLVSILFEKVQLYYYQCTLNCQGADEVAFCADKLKESAIGLYIGPRPWNK